MRLLRRTTLTLAVVWFVAVQLLVAGGSQASTPRRAVPTLKIVNYFPATAAWTRMWTAYSHDQVVSDFNAIKSLGGNTVRLIVAPAAMGFPNPSSTMRSHFLDAVATARRAGLSVQLTLFDWWHNYTDVAGSEQWLRSLLAGEAGNPTIALVELQNELPLSSPTALVWARQLLPFLNTVLPGVPRTISAAGSAGLAGVVSLADAFPRSSLDVVDVHYYGDPSMAAATLLAAKTVAAGRPVIIGEAGQSTTGAGGEEAQARFYRVMALVAAAEHLPPAAPWTLTDFSPTGPPHPIAPAEYHYGLRRLNGSWKPAAAVVRSTFAGALNINWDGGFEREHNAPVDLGSWKRFDVADGEGVVEHTLRRSGVSAVCFSGTRGSAAAVPSVMQAFPVLQAGRQITVTAWVRRSHATGSERVSLAWFDADGRYLGQSQSGSAGGDGYWQQLTVRARALPGAARVAVHLKAAQESGRACYDDAVISL